MSQLDQYLMLSQLIDNTVIFMGFYIVVGRRKLHIANKLLRVRVLELLWMKDIMFRFGGMSQIGLLSRRVLGGEIQFIFLALCWGVIHLRPLLRLEGKFIVSDQ